MKKLFIAALLLVFSMSAFASGPYDGIWIVEEEPNVGYIMVVENNEQQIIVVNLGLPGYGEERLIWEAMSGFRTNNTVRLSTIVTDTGNAVVDVSMSSLTTGTVTVVQCEPFSDYYCAVPVGSQYHIRKIW